MKQIEEIVEYKTYPLTKQEKDQKSLPCGCKNDLVITDIKSVNKPT